MDTISPAPSTHQSAEPSGRRKELVTIVFVAMLACPAYLLILLQRSTQSHLLRIGDLIPAVKLSESNKGQSLLAAIGGKSAAVFFFSTDCPHCQRQIPLFNEVCRRFGTRVEFVAIVISDEHKAISFVRVYGIRVPIIVDPEAVMGNTFAVSELPTLILINQDKTIEWIGVGERSRVEVFRRLSVLVEKNPSTQLFVRTPQDQQ
jgi:thiol-disulfide isomerase/thioredoxin